MNWTPQHLDHLGYLSRGRSRHRPRDAAHLYDGPYAFIQTGDVKHAGLYITDYRQTYSEAGLEQSRLWPAGTLCITIAANIADTAILGMEACFPDSVIGFIPDEGKADARFVKYLFDATVQRRVQQFTQGAAQDNLSQEKLLSIEFSVPGVEDQKRIADVLSPYDHWIENNRRRMALLEEAARQLYREWFVRLHFPGHEHTCINAGVPAGWERKNLGQMLTLKRGYDLPESRRAEGDVPIVSSSGITGFHNEKKAVAPGVVTGRYGTIGEVFFVQQDYWPLNTALYVSDFKGNPPAFVAYLLKHAIGGTQSDKAAVPGVNRNVLHRLTVLSPTKRLIDQFAEFAHLTYQQIHALETTNQKLRAARDLLLPRLMSGEIAV